VKRRVKAWALVLAGGDDASASLLVDALQRAEAVAPPERLCIVVAAQHRARWSDGVLGGLPESNIFVQPQNRGTAHGILLALVSIAARDPQAIVVALPSDHYFADEEAISRLLHRAAAIAGENRDTTYLLGVEPDEADPGLGYILPSSKSRRRWTRIVRFDEKPTMSQARLLVELGALWNVFIIAASVRALLSLYDSSFDSTMAIMRSGDRAAVDGLYRTLPTIDFYRDILQASERNLRVLPIPRCGWTDLGTPDRIARMARRMDDAGSSHPPILSFGANLGVHQPKLP
jgi:mannose-1-phosphate guanylyltransferase